jgi:hypothetical protein
MAVKRGIIGGSRYDFSHAWLYMQKVMHDFSYA